MEMRARKAPGEKRGEIGSAEELSEPQAVHQDEMRPRGTTSSTAVVAGDLKSASETRVRN